MFKNVYSHFQLYTATPPILFWLFLIYLSFIHSSPLKNTRNLQGEFAPFPNVFKNSLLCMMESAWLRGNLLIRNPGNGVTFLTPLKWCYICMLISFQFFNSWYGVILNPTMELFQLKFCNTSNTPPEFLEGGVEITPWNQLC